MKKNVCLMMVLMMIISFTACGPNEAVETPREIAGDEIITTYAYADLTEVDVEGLDEVKVDALDITKVDESTDETIVYQVAFFGEVKNVKVNYSDYVYESLGMEIDNYDSLKDTILTIESNKLDDFTGFFIFFDDGRGLGHSFILGDEMVMDINKIELVSGFTAEEKTPSEYEAYDMTEIIEAVGMSVNQFENSDIMQYSEKMILPGMDDDYYSFTVTGLIKGIVIEYTGEVADETLTSCFIRTDESYDSLSNDEKYSFMGVDFEMTEIRAMYNEIKPEGLKDLYQWNDAEKNVIDTIVIN